MSETKTHIAVILDRSGSMESIASAMQNGLRSFLSEQKSVEGKCRVTIAQFDHEYELLHNDVSLRKISPSSLFLIPRGSTALYDAIGETLTSLDRSINRAPLSKKPDKVIVVIVTDGFENASMRWNKMQIRDLINKCQKNEWEFTFLGANQDAIMSGGDIGIHPRSSMTYAPTDVGIGSTWTSLGNATRNYRYGVAANLAYTQADRDAAVDLTPTSTTGSSN